MRGVAANELITKLMFDVNENQEAAKNVASSDKMRRIPKTEARPDSLTRKPLAPSSSTPARDPLTFAPDF